MYIVLYDSKHYNVENIQCCDRSCIGHLTSTNISTVGKKELSTKEEAIAFARLNPGSTIIEGFEFDIKKKGKK